MILASKLLKASWRFRVNLPISKPQGKQTHQDIMTLVLCIILYTSIGTKWDVEPWLLSWRSAAWCALDKSCDRSCAQRYVERPCRCYRRRVKFEWFVWSKMWRFFLCFFWLCLMICIDLLSCFPHVRRKLLELGALMFMVLLGLEASGPCSLTRIDFLRSCWTSRNLFMCRCSIWTRAKLLAPQKNSALRRHFQIEPIYSWEVHFFEAAQRNAFFSKKRNDCIITSIYWIDWSVWQSTTNLTGVKAKFRRTLAPAAAVVGGSHSRTQGEWKLHTDWSLQPPMSRISHGISRDVSRCKWYMICVWYSIRLCERNMEATLQATAFRNLLLPSNHHASCMEYTFLNSKIESN